MCDVTDAHNYVAVTPSNGSQVKVGEKATFKCTDDDHVFEGTSNKELEFTCAEGNQFTDLKACVAKEITVSSGAPRTAGFRV